MNLPRVKLDKTLPASGDGGGPVESPRYPEVALEQGGLQSDLANYVALVLKHKYMIMIVVTIFLFGGVIVTLQMPRIYSASTTVKIDRLVPQIFKSQYAQVSVWSDDTQFYETQYELIRSRAIAERVTTALDLTKSDFLGGPQQSWLQRLFGRKSNPAPVPDVDAGRVRHAIAVSQVMAGLSVQPVKQSSIVRITYSAKDPTWAQRISIAVAEQFEKITLDALFAASSHARRFLQEQLDEQRLKLEESEKQLIQYAKKEGIVDIDNKQPQVLAELQAVQSAYSNAVTARTLLEETWRQAQADGGNSLPQVMSDSLIHSARARLSQLRGTYQHNLTVFGPASPKMTALQNEMSATEKDIRAEIELVKGSIYDQYQLAAANEKSLGGKLDQLKADALDLRRRSVEYAILMRDVDTNRSLYDGVLQQYQELGVASDAQSNNVSVLDRALLPEQPTSPSLRVNLIVALALGAVAAAGAVWLIEMHDDTFKSTADLEERLGLPVLGVIPLYRDLAKKKSAISELLDDPSSLLAESCRLLRTAIQFSTSDGSPQSILITSSRPGEGKSTIASSLAANFGQLGMRVLLIDADMRNPSLHRIMNLENSVGLSNYLSGGDYFIESQRAGSAPGILKQTSIPNLVVMTCGPLPPNPVELLAGPRLGILLSEAARSFDIIIINSPAIMGHADAPILSAAADATILLVEGAKTRRSVVRDALKRLRFVRARVVGEILNKDQANHAGRSFGHEHGYAYVGGANKYAYGEGGKQALDKQRGNDA